MKYYLTRLLTCQESWGDRSLYALDEVPKYLLDTTAIGHKTTLRGLECRVIDEQELSRYSTPVSWHGNTKLVESYYSIGD